MGTRGEARADAILDAVAELLSEVGYDRLTTDAVVNRAQASKTTLYRRWPGGKAELVAAVLQRAADCAPAEAKNTGSVEGDLRACLTSMADTLTGRSGPALIGLLDAARQDAALREQMRRLFEASCRENATALTRYALARGEHLDEALVYEALRVAFAWTMSRMVFDGATPSAETCRDFVSGTLSRLVSD
ncbi:TetR/AcrR family transcriptional regulator [Actinoplanes sp. NPDC049265]|uniref:TetR/AcrR family transcriptional regulator n=1 Tax=Actinoplanes sp. NPDC049265 TaxID=3363902 RepID=UPI003711D956